MHLFYCSDIENATVITLNEEESRHCVSVLRKRVGDIIEVIDGKGGWYKAEIVSNHAKRCELTILETVSDYGKRNYKLHIAMAPTKNIDRFEWFVEKAVELGIDEITPLICKHSERKTINHERIQRLIISATKQSLKAFVPILHNEISFESFVGSEYLGKKAIAYCNSNDVKLPNEIFVKGNDALVLIGPEGDFSKEEIELAVKYKYSALSLGASRLRTETAGLTACSAIYLLNQ